MRSEGLLEKKEKGKKGKKKKGKKSDSSCFCGDDPTRWKNTVGTWALTGNAGAIQYIVEPLLPVFFII